MGLLFITHDLGIVRRIADRVLRDENKGEIVGTAPPKRDIFENREPAPITIKL